MCIFRRRRQRRATLFPYTTLFRSEGGQEAGGVRVGLGFIRDWSEDTATAVVTERTRRGPFRSDGGGRRSEEHTSELQSRLHLVCRLLLEKKKKTLHTHYITRHHLI